MDFPFEEEKIKDNIFIRTFSVDVDEMDLIWHRDHNDRQIVVVEGNAWKLQKDNEEPVILEHGVIYEIKAMEYHRIIKGYGDLVLIIHEKQII